MGAFFLAYMGKWVRRSNVMTAAEWMKTRFADSSKLLNPLYPKSKILKTVFPDTICSFFSAR
jgi:hypothetical protein